MQRYWFAFIDLLGPSARTDDDLVLPENLGQPPKHVELDHVPISANRVAGMAQSVPGRFVRIGTSARSRPPK
jgi:hypothetical protein